MSRSLGNIIADTLQLSVGYAERLLKGVPADRFGRFAQVGGTVVESNNPAFIYGHLSLYAPKVLQQIEHPAPGVPDHFEHLFSKDASCKDDVDGDLYPPMDEITTFFSRATGCSPARCGPHRTRPSNRQTRRRVG